MKSLSTLTARDSVWLRRLLLIASGAVTGCCVAFDGIGLLQWISMVPAIYIFLLLANDGSVPYRVLYGSGFLYFYSYSLVIFHWFWRMYPLEFTGLTPPAALSVVLVAWLGLSLLQTLFGALLPLAFAYLVRGRWLRCYPLLQIVVLAALWCIREWAQTLTWAGVPWGRLALGQLCLPVMVQNAQWLGSYFITFFLVLLNGCVAYSLYCRQSRRLCAWIALGLVLFQVSSGTLLLLMEQTVQKDEPSVRVAAVQGNVGSADKWNMGIWETFQIYYHLSEQAAENGAVLIVWPETAVPADVAASEQMAQPLCALARQYEVTLAIGTFMNDEQGNEYNAVRLILPDGTWADPAYFKRHLVPFGEYVPLRSLIMAVIPALGGLSQLSYDLTAGDDAAVAFTDWGAIGSLICFDSIYEELALDSVRSGAQLLTVSTNDSWFFDSAAAQMHLRQSRLRAIETGRYVIRAANTGISAVISPDGAVTAQLEALKEGVVYGEVALRTDRTLYTLTGNLWIVLCAACCSLVLGERIGRTLSVKNESKRVVH